jgi:hypothetical protein
MTDEYYDVNFDWSPLGFDFWKTAAESCTHKPTPQQLKFACRRHDGLNATDCARAAEYAGDDDTIRISAHRASKSTAVSELLAYAYAATGKGDAGVVSGKEARQILSRIARKGENNARIKALESLARMDEAAEEANRKAAEEEAGPKKGEGVALIIKALPADGVGAAIALGLHYNRQDQSHRRISWFPFLEECAPIVSRKYPENWQRWRKHCEQPALANELAYIDHCANGRLLDGDELVAAVQNKLESGSFSHPFKSEKSNAT